MKNFKRVLSICLMSTLIVSYASQYVGAVDDTSMESEVSSVVESDSGGMSEDNTETSKGTEQSEESGGQSEENGVDSSIDVCFYLRPRTQGSIIISPIYHSDHHRL